ncbi:DUF2892 domain-containing protein [Alkalilimnicola ehrlichii MLHE-1]|uniref:Inner membrane protein YgaP-like transmembrane domain-containing protein n=1 Tax=Alkalilimnicola ehrlichii (strain ATCC BAA-1101 / DSM 17681 / MLHE-1) TaxID=187272 RepID=Q0A506_ALKEH|nr:DUF2892 domain-containing protein [Alkalilimnicola ehrlichii]ABI58081.1 conserved hypothetical protein [Alkalilimnicola ehrlichii MLHE-1]
MTVNAGLRMLAGFFVLLTVVLAYAHHEAWLLFTAFVGLNLLQSAFSGWCPAMAVLRKLGFKQERPV